MSAPTDAGGAVSEALQAAQTFIDEYFVATDDNEDAALAEISDTIEAALTPAPQAEGAEPEYVEEFWPALGHVKISKRILAGSTPAPKPDGEDHKRHLCNLLARIHRDGGHHVEAVGLAQAVEDADRLVADWIARPLQQGGEVTREQVAREIAEGLSHLIDPAVINGASSRVAGRILALFASLAADRDKAVGLLRSLMEKDADHDGLFLMIGSYLSRQKDQPHD